MSFSSVWGRLLQRRFGGPVLLTLVFSLGVLLFYLRGPVNGHFEQIFLPAKMFGIPSDLRAHGITPLYMLKDETGWDGQFYFSIANDPFALRDTPRFIDSPPYRYQRIGLPLLANIVSKIFFQSWVSPAVYYGTALGFLLLAVGFASAFLARQGASPFLILLWSLGAGTQITLLNGLPDGTADALFILATLALLADQKIFYLLAITFAALSREIFVLIPCFVGLGLLWRFVRVAGWQSLLSWARVRPLLGQLCLQALPVLVVVGWQLFIRVRFGVFASSQAAGILGLPFQSLAEHMFSGLAGHHWLVGDGKPARYEGIGVLLFLGLVLAALYALGGTLRKTFRRMGDSVRQGHAFALTLGLTVIALTYFCFGKTVMMHFTGYFKAANLFLFVVPFMYALRRQKMPRLLLIFSIIVVAFFAVGLKDRVFASPYLGKYTTLPDGSSYADAPPACLSHYETAVSLVGIDDPFPRRGLGRLLAPAGLVLRVKVTNKGAETLQPYLGAGGVNVGAQWLNQAGAPVLDGQRSALPTLKPGASAEVAVVVPFPRRAGAYTLSIGPVQEGCTWFVARNPNSAFNIPYHID